MQKIKLCSIFFFREQEPRFINKINLLLHLFRCKYSQQHEIFTEISFKIKRKETETI